MTFRPIYVGDVGELTTAALKQHFSQFGAITAVRRKEVASKREAGTVNKIAFVHFDLPSSAAAAVAYGSFQQIEERPVTVSRADSVRHSEASLGNAASEEMPKAEEDFLLFGNFADHKGTRLYKTSLSVLSTTIVSSSEQF